MISSCKVINYIVIFPILFLSSCAGVSDEGRADFITGAQIGAVSAELVATHGEAERDRIEKGVGQAARLWRSDDGSPEEFAEFCSNNFISDPELLVSTFHRYEKNLESVIGHLTEISRDLSEPLDLDIGPMLPVDYLFAQYSPGAHVTEDFFNMKIAFVVLLNFPLHTLEERLSFGPGWSRLEWAQARLAESFSTRVPPEINQEVSRAYVRAHDYVNKYNIYMHHVLTEDGRRLFPAGMKLLSHWNLRDELKSRYADPQGVSHQEMIQLIMKRIIRQEIPAIVIDNPAVDWTPASNGVAVSPVHDFEGVEVTESKNSSPEPDRRYSHILEIFNAERLNDPYYPDTPTLMDRRFQRNREIPEARVEEMFKNILSSPVTARTAEFISERLVRPLRPFDIWYNGFKPSGTYQESDLDRIVSRRYPTPQAFDADLPNLLRRLGFSAGTADFLASKVTVDPARGSGHAMGAGRRADNAHLRTRVPPTGMNYKGYNIAVHEFGHNCEQVLSLNRVDLYMLSGVPNNAFTEAFAFVFQDRDLELLGLSQEDPDAEHLKALDVLWNTFEIAGVSLVEMEVWHWMYDHPDATAAELKEAVIRIAGGIWNTYYAPMFGEEDVILLAIYSHMIDYGLYLPDYPMGHIISFQIEEYLKGRNLGTEMERMCVLGNITPDAWMQAAVGEPISERPMLQAAERALRALREQ